MSKENLPIDTITRNFLYGILKNKNLKILTPLHYVTYVSCVYKSNSLIIFHLWDIDGESSAVVYTGRRSAWRGWGVTGKGQCRGKKVDFH